jgi:hypothetical protein
MSDPGWEQHAAIRNWIEATPGEYYVAQVDPANPPSYLNDPTALGFTTGKGVLRVGASWWAGKGENEAVDAEAFATFVNTCTASGRQCVIDEVKSDTTDYLGLAIPLLTNPDMIHFYLVNGKNVSYEVLDSPPYEGSFLRTALVYGCGILPEMYVDQYAAERSGDMNGFIDQWFVGPGDSKMPYLLRLMREEYSPSIVRFVIPVYDRLKIERAGRKVRLGRAVFLDRLMQRALLRYPQVYRNGVCTWKWDSSVVKKADRASNVVALLDFYRTGAGATSGGRTRLFT